MDQLLEEKSQKAPRSPGLCNYFYFPSGSFSSLMSSVISDENKSSYEEMPNDQSCHIITYESICSTSQTSKETQTEVPQEKLIIKELTASISDLKSKYEALKKQNSDLKSELAFQSIQNSKSKDQPLREEVKKLKANINFHQTMVEKIAALAADITGDNESPNKSRIDVHIYNFIISKLEIIRSRMKRYKAKIHSMETEKNSLTELLGFYAGATKLIENSKFACFDLMQESNGPLISSRKSSALMENSSNTIRGNNCEEGEFRKKTLSFGDGHLDSSLPNTVGNLKGISKLANTVNGFKKNKACGSCSVSPLLPKPKKGKGTNSKENFKSSTVKVGKAAEDSRKRRMRCKS